MTPIDQQSTDLLYGFCARTSGAKRQKKQKSQLIGPLVTIP